MRAMFTDTSSRRAISRCDAAVLNFSAATFHCNQPIDANGSRLLSPHEIALLMVLASESRCPQVDPADLRCLIDLGLVQLDVVPLAETTVRLSANGRQTVLRLAGQDCFEPSRNAYATAACHTITRTMSIGASH
ncbi:MULTISPECIES: hypothetical protein [Burkholderia]|uniref:hypothetical protein n=1 Tax=Burkholderia TaxID=32008 RepID=UPI00158D8A1F|nr:MULTISPECIES: hypothetical protein [Burkholderia]